jgi:hypothetical protein
MATVTGSLPESGNNRHPGRLPWAALPYIAGIRPGTTAIREDCHGLPLLPGRATGNTPQERTA